jgi:hypothetical protein
MTARDLRRLAGIGLLVLSCGTTAAPATARIEQLGWLAGCWAGDRPGEPARRSEEQWMLPRAGSMLGMGRTLRGEALSDYEHLLIREQGATLVYVAKPAGQPQASFEAVAIDDAGVVFENPAHDFPQRIVYRRQPDGALLARIEGQLKGQPRSVDFPMRRVACPG